MPSSNPPFLTRVHHYGSPTPHSCAYESGAFLSPNAILAIGGLGDGPHTVPYFQALAVSLESRSEGPGYSVFEIRMKSSFTGYGMSSLAEDVAHISALVRYLRRIGKKKIVLLGHSTGCQDIMEYVDYEKHNSEPVDGFILQGPVSDREAIEAENTAAGTGVLEKSLALAWIMTQDGKGDDFMPHYAVPGMLSGAPISARRLFSLAAKGGGDDYFSSDLDKEHVTKVWSRFDKPFLVLHSAEDEYVPAHIDKDALVERWAKANARMSRLSGSIPGANHTVDSAAARKWFADAVVGFLGTV